MRHGRPGCRVRGGCAESERGRRVAQPAGTRTGTTGWTGDPTAPAPVASAPSAQQRHDAPTAAGMEAREGRAPPRAASELAAELKQDAEPRRPARAPPPAPRKTLKAVLRDATPAQGGSARPPGPPRSPCARGRGRRTSRCTCCGSSSDDGTSALTVEPRSPHEHARSSSWALGGEGQTSCCTRAPGSAQGAAQDWHRPDMLRRWTESHPGAGSTTRTCDNMPVSCTRTNENTGTSTASTLGTLEKAQLVSRDRSQTGAGGRKGLLGETRGSGTILYLSCGGYTTARVWPNPGQGNTKGGFNGRRRRPKPDFNNTSNGRTRPLSSCRRASIFS